MKQEANLRFLLSLGNQKIVAVHQGEQMHVYATDSKKCAQVSPRRIAAVLDSR